MKKIFAPTFAFALLLPAAAAYAQQGSTPTTKTTPQTTNTPANTTANQDMNMQAKDREAEMMRELDSDLTDAELASRIHKTNQHEIEMGNLALTQATSKAVKDFAKMLVADHEKADKKLTELATKKSWSLAETSPAKDEHMQQKEQDMKSMTGAAFDRHFLVMMQKGHSHAILMVTAQAFGQPIDKDLKQAIQTELPTLEKHRKKSIDILQSEGNKSQPRG